MTGIRTGIELNDGFTEVMNQIINSVNVGVSAVQNMQQIMNTSVNSTAFDSVQSEIAATISAVNDLQSTMTGTVLPTVEPIEPMTTPDPVQVPVTPVVTAVPQDNITVPVTPAATEQKPIAVPELDVSNVQQYSGQIGSVQNLLQQVATIQQDISTRSQGLQVIPDDVKNQISAVNASIERMQQELNMIQGNPFDFDSEVVEQQIVAVINELRDALNVQKQLSDGLSHMDVEIEQPPPVEVPVEPRIPTAPVEVPVVWQSDHLDVFTGTGVERFRQEVSGVNTMLEQLSGTQDTIARQAYNTNILPPEAFQNLNSMAVRIDMVRNRLQQIGNNPVNMGTDRANMELEQLRTQLNQAIQQQNSLNTAISNMDVSAANSAYLQLSQTVSGTERYIRGNVDEQGRFNQEIQEGTVQANDLMNTIKGVAAAYISIQTVGEVLNISDALTMTTARLNLMNDQMQTTPELFNMIYASARNTHAPLLDTANAIAKMGNNAGAAFNSSAELVAFMEQVNKQFVIGGATATEQSNALMQLSQAMAAGALRGEELNSILDAAPGIARTIEQSMGWAEGSIKSYAEEGAVTAQVVKHSLLDMADETNAAFDSMPVAFSQVMTDIQSDAVIAFQPVLQRLNDIANSEAFQSFANGAIEAMAVLANIVLNIFDLIGTVGSSVADNWSIIAPIVYGVAAALAVYYGWLLLTQAAELAVKVIQGAAAVVKGILAAGYMILTGATWAAATAQYGLNGAMYSCPIVWIIILIIALIAIIFAVCNAIADMTGIANTGFGIITGGINVVIQFFKNLGLAVANIALGIANAIAALGSNIMTAFHNAISSVQSWWYDLLSDALTVIGGICEALNKLPFVEFDYSGITNAASRYASKAAEAAGDKEDYTSVSDAFNEGMSTFDVFQDGWMSDAFNAGASWGDGVMDDISNFSLSDLFGGTDLPNPDDYTFDSELSGIGDGIGGIADDTSAIKDSMELTEEDLKYLRDLAETEAVNRYTVAEIQVDMSGMQNTIKNGDDIDGFMSSLTDSVNEAVDNITEGVHK